MMVDRPLLFPFVSGLMVLLIGLAGNAAMALAARPDVPPAPPSRTIPDRYIVVFHQSVPSAAAAATDLERGLGLGVSHVYAHALKGFAAEVPPGRLVALRRDPRVAYVEADQTVHAFAQTVPTGVRRILAPGNGELWMNGLDDWRVDVGVAVIDTGIASHPDLNVVGRTNCSGGSPVKSNCVDGGTDGNGHGTHVAGTIGALDNDIGVVGVAPGARLWSVKVLNDQGSGQMSWIVAGIDWVTARAGTIGVANMSLGCECTSAALNTAIGNSVAKGVVYVVAAGNSAKDAATFSPANHPDVIAVSALADFDGQAGGLGTATCRSDMDDTRADFSNFGSRVAIAAPGVCITSTWTNGAYATLSGTSMASPHVAGAAALLVSRSKPTNRDGVLGIRASLIATGNLDWIDDSGDGIKERLLDVSNAAVFAPELLAGSAPPSDDDPPTVVIASPTSGTVAGTVTLEAITTDDHGVTKVEFLLDGTPVGEAVSAGDSWSLDWSSTSVSNGDYALTARATDTSGQQTSSQPVAITVWNSPGSGGPTANMGIFSISSGLTANKHLDVVVSIRRDTAPTYGALTSADALVGGAAVTFTLKNGNSTWVFSGTTDSSGNFRGRLTNAPGGSYTITVTAVSAAGLTWTPALDLGNPATFTK